MLQTASCALTPKPRTLTPKRPTRHVAHHARVAGRLPAVRAVFEKKRRDYFERKTGMVVDAPPSALGSWTWGVIAAVVVAACAVYFAG